MNEARRDMVRQYNAAREQAKQLTAKLEKLEAEEGDVDYDAAAVMAVDNELAELRRAIVRMHGWLYPKGE